MGVKVRVRPMTKDQTIKDQSGVVDCAIEPSDTIAEAKAKLEAVTRIPADMCELKFQTNFIGRIDNQDADSDESVAMGEATTFFKWHEKFPDWYLEADFLKDPPDPDPAKYWRDKKKKEIEERLAKGEKVEDWEYNGLEAEFGR